MEEPSAGSFVGTKRATEQKMMNKSSCFGDFTLASSLSMSVGLFVGFFVCLN